MVEWELMGGIPGTPMHVEDFDLDWCVCMLCYPLLPLPRPPTSHLPNNAACGCGFFGTEFPTMAVKQIHQKLHCRA